MPSLNELLLRNAELQKLLSESCDECEKLRGLITGIRESLNHNGPEHQLFYDSIDAAEAGAKES